MFIDLAPSFLVICLSYLLGSIPFGLILTKLAGAGDIRKIGSGNIGATNVLRTGNKRLAIATLLFDLTKGAASVLLATHLTSPSITAMAAVLVVVGHCFPCWLKFRGGKGVATSLAAMTALDISFGFIFTIVWMITALVWRYSSLAALSAMLACTIAGFILTEENVMQIAVLILSALVWSRHHENIHRLLTNTENKIGTPKK